MMLSQYLFPVYAGFGGAATLALVFSFAPLTGGGSSATKSEEYVIQATAERTYCSSNLSDVNCVCFGRISGQILSDKQPKVPGAYYASKQDLARGQALKSC